MAVIAFLIFSYTSFELEMPLIRNSDEKEAITIVNDNNKSVDKQVESKKDTPVKGNPKIYFAG